MRHKAKGRWIASALDHMVMSNRLGAQCLVEHGSRAATDITGFGLLGHLVEMVRASEVDVVLDLNSVPLMDGAEDTAKAGILSSLSLRTCVCGAPWLIPRRPAKTLAIP